MRVMAAAVWLECKQQAAVAFGVLVMQLGGPALSPSNSTHLAAALLLSVSRMGGGWRQALQRFQGCATQRLRNTNLDHWQLTAFVAVYALFSSRKVDGNLRAITQMQQT